MQLLKVKSMSTTVCFTNAIDKRMVTASARTQYAETLVTAELDTLIFLIINNYD